MTLTVQKGPDNEGFLFKEHGTGIGADLRQPLRLGTVKNVSDAYRSLASQKRCLSRCHFAFAPNGSVQSARPLR